MTRILLVAAATALAAGSVACRAAPTALREAGDRPNFVLVFVDDMGYTKPNVFNDVVTEP